MSKHSPNAAGQSAFSSLSQSAAALVHELSRVRQDLTALKARLGGQGAALSPRDVLFALQDVAQWISIALELEITYEKHTRSPQPGGRERALDLEAARLSIGGKLDRLRAAAGAERVSERAE